MEPIIGSQTEISFRNDGLVVPYEVLKRNLYSGNSPSVVQTSPKRSKHGPNDPNTVQMVHTWSKYAPKSNDMFDSTK